MTGVSTGSTPAQQHEPDYTAISSASRIYPSNISPASPPPHGDRTLIDACSISYGALCCKKVLRCGKTIILTYTAPVVRAVPGAARRLVANSLLDQFSRSGSRGAVAQSTPSGALRRGLTPAAHGCGALFPQRGRQWPHRHTARLR